MPTDPSNSNPQQAGGPSPPVFVLNVPGLDRRRIDPEAMPFLHALLRDYPAAQWDGHPTTEIWPTLVTGVNPGAHKIWHCRFDDQGPPKTLGQKLLCALPDKLVATAQLFRHFVDRDYEMPCIPYRRRRHLSFHRLKFNNRSQPERYRTVGGVGTLFKELGDKAQYHVTGRFEDFDAMLAKLPVAGLRLQWFEIHAYDIAVHYNIHKPEALAKYGRQLDDMARTLHERCEQQGIRFALVVDHGQEPTVGSVNLEKVLRRSGANRSDYVYFTAVGVAKFWFRTDAARRAVSEALGQAEHVNVMDSKQLNATFGFDLGPEWGELYAIADNDHVFFPHDFHHLLAHIHLGLTSSAMRGRLTHRNMAGYHGLMPGHPAELGYMLVADPGVQPTVGPDDMIQIVDVAPTLLSLVGQAPAEHMNGRVVMHPAVSDAESPDRALSA